MGRIPCRRCQRAAARDYSAVGGQNNPVTAKNMFRDSSNHQYYNKLERSTDTLQASENKSTRDISKRLLIALLIHKT
jgi:hypothetical protein